MRSFARSTWALCPGRSVLGVLCAGEKAAGVYISVVARCLGLAISVAPSQTGILSGNLTPHETSAVTVS